MQPSSNTELSRLVPYSNQNPLWCACERILSKHEAQIEHPSRRFLRYIVSGLAVSLGSLAGIPFYTPTIEIFENFSGLGVFFGVTTVFVLGVSASWALLQNAQRLRPSLPDERIIFQASTTKRLLKHILSNGLGLMASIPLAYATFKYNTHKWFALIAFSAGYGFNTFGYYQIFGTFNQCFKRFQVPSEDQASLREASHLLQSESERALCTLYREDLVRYNVMCTMSDHQKKLDALLRACEETRRIHHLNFYRSAYYSINALLGLLSCANAAKDYLFAEEFFETELSLGVSAWILSIISVGAGLFLGFYSIDRTTQRMLNALGEGRFTQYNRSVIGLHCGMLSYLALCLPILLTACASLGDSYLSYQNVGESRLFAFRIPLTLTTFLGNVIFHTFTMHQQINDASICILRCHPSNQTQSLVVLLSEANQIAQLLGHVNDRHASAYLSRVDHPSLKQRLSALGLFFRSPTPSKEVSVIGNRLSDGSVLHRQ